MPKQINIDTDKLQSDYFIKNIPVKDLQKIYGVSRAYIYKILKGKTKADILFNADKFKDNLSDKLAEKLDILIQYIDSDTISKASLSQRTQLLTALIDRIRLLDGKTTQNISTTLYNKLDSKDLELIKSTVKQLTESRLNESKAKVSKKLEVA
jgi:predicted transcriptional regulator